MWGNPPSHTGKCPTGAAIPLHLYCAGSSEPLIMSHAGLFVTFLMKYVTVPMLEVSDLVKFHLFNLLPA